MNKLSGLSPSLVWKYFYEISQIPRPSKQEEKIVSYLIRFAHENNLMWKKDKAGNVVIKKPARPGSEQKQTCVLQSHVDMVCEKNEDVEFNFSTDPIDVYIEDGWVKAKGTTLGADNGIGMAAQLAVLADSTINHGKLECLFTADEETGLTGAKRIHPRLITGTKLLNLDSEEDGEICIGCAGGIDTVISIPYKTEATSGNYAALKIQVSGLAGGHSGTDISLNRANSVKIISKLLLDINKDYPVNLSDIQGGNLRNAIPREANACITLSKEDSSACIAKLNELIEQTKNKIKVYEPSIVITIDNIDLPEQHIQRDIAIKILDTLYTCPNGVIEISPDMPDLVQTSTNLASVKKEDKYIEVVTSQRSSVDESKIKIAGEIKNHFKSLSAKVENSDPYPGWQPNTNSELLQVTKNAYQSIFNEQPEVKAIHAGLECGLFLKKYPQLDMISFGPTIRDAHSPYEKMEIETVGRFWKWLVEVLENIPNR